MCFSSGWKRDRKGQGFRELVMLCLAAGCTGFVKINDTAVMINSHLYVYYPSI